MANNRLWIKDKETGEQILLCKSMGGGWYVWHMIEELEEWLKFRDRKASFGNVYEMKNTKLILYAENDEEVDNGNSV